MDTKNFSKLNFISLIYVLGGGGGTDEKTAAISKKFSANSQSAMPCRQT